MRDGFVKVAAVTPEVRVADVSFNVEACVSAARQAAEKDGAAVIVLPELAITGYTCEDLFWQESLVRAAEAGLAEFAARTADLPALILVGVPVRADELTLDAPSALLMEKQTGTVLFAKDEHTPREPASVTKVMTLLLTMEAIDSGALSYDARTPHRWAAARSGSKRASRCASKTSSRPCASSPATTRPSRSASTWQAARKRLSRA